MCWPLAVMAPYIAMATAAAGTAAGAVMQSRAASNSASAIAAQNAAMQRDQNQAFAARLQASREQSDAQFMNQQTALGQRTEAARAMREAQGSALQHTHDVIAAENATAEQLRAAGDERAQALLAATSGPNLDKSQSNYEDKTAALLAGAEAASAGPDATSPSGDPETAKATARRLGIASANIRQYGKDIARVASYGQPLVDIGQAIQASNTGIMPAQEAERLLRAGAATRLFPGQLAFSQATNLGGATDTAIQQQLENANTYAGLKYNNATTLANLQQADTDTVAKNVNEQKQADAKFQASLGSLTTTLGNLGMYAAGRYGPQTISGLGAV